MKIFPYKVLSSYLFFHLLSYKGNRPLLPTSPVRDYGDSQGNKRRRSRSASVRFVNETDTLDQVLSTNGSFFPKWTVCGHQTLHFCIRWGYSDDTAKNVSAMKCAFNVMCRSSLGRHLIYVSWIFMRSYQYGEKRCIWSCYQKEYYMKIIFVYFKPCMKKKNNFWVCDEHSLTCWNPTWL